MTDDAIYEKEDAHWLVRYIKHGEPDGSGFPRTILGFYLHWRTWGLMAVTFFPFLATLLVYDAYGASTAILVGPFIGLFAGGWALRVSSKYNVTKNY